MKQFSKSRRKFVKISEYQEELPNNGIVVKGSNGKSYIIVDNKCSCPGFKFRGQCKHLDKVA
jgi:predicted nucleic acid-binding Zn finger protein